ncbi:MAG: hypothetical protein IPK93_04610 [Solirubrobacterales bacterium]|nr:hypothetical protein [Solirubrobacterales bacterium]
MCGAVAQALVGALSVGISTDEAIQVLRTSTWINDGWFLPNNYLSDGDPIPDVGSITYVYGPAFSAISHAINVMVGNESLSSVSITKSAWSVRHMTVAMTGLATSGVVGLGVWSLTRSRLFALWSVAALLAIPLWTGMSFFNPKDVPVGAGYTCLTVGLILALDDKWLLKSFRIRSFLTGGLIAVGLFLAVGTRLAMWIPLTFSLIGFGVLLPIMAPQFEGTLGSRARLGMVLIGSAAGTAALIAVYPTVFLDPLSFLSRSVSASSNYPHPTVTFTAGHTLTQNPPWWYLPVWGFAATPILIGIAFCLGFVTTIHKLFRGWKDGLTSWKQEVRQRRELPTLLAIGQVCVLPLASIIVGASMYSGFRQHLYVMPALAILAGVGSFRAWTILREDHRGKGGLNALTILLSLALLVPMVEGAMLSPYNYTYINPIAGLKGINSKWETDFWWTSSREALSKIPPNIAPLCTSELIPRRNIFAQIYVFDCRNQPQFGPYLDEDSRESDPPGNPTRKSWVIARARGGDTVPGFCTEKSEVSRWLRGERVLMARILLCDTKYLKFLQGVLDPNRQNVHASDGTQFSTFERGGR